ncbi:MAG: acyltransferase family protein [Eubacterium sp.]|nr:acyltransferase family protein [Eubacterium sp.]
MNRVFTNCNRLMIETGIVLSIIIFTVFMFVIPTYEKTEKKIAIETTGILTPNALSDGVQIIAINVEGERQDLPSLLGNPDWQYEGGKYTWNACRGSNNRIEFNVSFRELEIIFLKNSWCGGAKIYVNDILSDTIDFYAENDTEFSWKINGAAIMGQKQRAILACVVSVGIWMLFIVINSLVRKKVPAESKVEITNRIIWIDILKGMGVLMVIAGHNLNISPISATLIWSVHMPLFFIVTGYTFKKKETFERIKKDAKVLLVPYACGVIILLISNIIYNCICSEPR